MKVWIELQVKDRPSVFLPMKHDGYVVCRDGSVSNWLDIIFSMKGWSIVAVGVMAKHIIVQVE
jgi:hypothetical protein